jgi:outer membrane protein insertion porin family/translocation and assembly module TamA
MTRQSCVGFLFVVMFATTACSRVPAGRSSVDAIEIRGARALDGDELLEKLATTPTPKFLGLFRGVFFDYELFDRGKLQRDLERVERFYADHGYFDARARAARVITIDPKHVRVEIDVEEGAPSTVDVVDVEFTDELPGDERARVATAIRGALRAHAPFDAESFANASDEGAKLLTDHGRPYAKVTREAYVDVVTHHVRLAFSVTAGRAMRYGDVTIEGLGKIPESAVRRAAALTPGDPYSSSEIDAAEQAILELGVFSTVRVEANLTAAGTDDRIPIVIHLEPTALKAVTLGLGAELDTLRTDFHGSVAWENKNFVGGLRSLRLRLAPGLVLWPTRIDQLVAPTRALPEVRALAELRQPGFIEGRTTGTLRFEGSIAPFLLPGTTPDQPVLGYLEAKGAAGVERRFGRLFARLSYTAQYDWPFAYVGDRTDAVVPIVLSYLELVNAFDLRNDAIHPTKGVYVSLGTQAAGGPFFGDAADVRLQPEVRGYVPLGTRVTIAARVAFGFVFPFDWGAHLTNTTPSTERNRDLEIAMFRGLYAGGASSNRGYPLRGIGPHAAMPFVTEQVAATCTFASTAAGCLLPTGGLTSWEASLEVRVKVAGPFSTAVFGDAADVSPYRGDVRFARPHFSVGVGARYDTPVGPIRLDIATRIPGGQYFEDVSETERAAEDPGTILGLPVAIAIGIGEAF